MGSKSIFEFPFRFCQTIPKDFFDYEECFRRQRTFFLTSDLGNFVLIVVLCDLSKGPISEGALGAG